ncbi:MAG TPA: helix-turn-helix domain-containing protein [Pseudonocardiaceae bacterium]|jgi:AcrR family transcriptional regulator|nr:helix-turn-helix domain-containing protein [Pseudonocardiaceae bacterium]
MQERASESTRRERLLSAGREAFGRRPYDEVSLSEVAAEAGVAHGLPFHYFTNKRGFFLEVVRSMAAEMRLVHAVPPDLPPAGAMRSVMHQHIDYFQSRPHTLLGPMSSNLVTDPRVRDAFDEARWVGALSVLSLIGIDEPTAGVRLAMHAWLAFHDDLLTHWLVEPEFERERIVDLLLASLASTLESVTLLEPHTHFDLAALRG